MTLLRVLGVAFGVAVSVGATLGVGILRTPGMVAREAGSGFGAMLLWTAGAAFALLAAASIAELAVAVPKAGGFYGYVQEAYGEAPAFATGWADWLSQVTAIAYAAVTAEDLAGRLGYPVPGLALGLIAGIAAIQWLGVRAAARFQEAISLALCAGYVGFAAAAFFSSGEPVATQAAVPAGGIAGFAIALRAVVVTYDGWQVPAYFAEEVRDPARSVPRSMIRGVLLVGAVYLVLNGAFLSVLGFGTLTSSEFPAADAARALWGDGGDRLVSALALMAMPSLANSVTMLGTRIAFAVSRDGIGPRWTARVNRRGTPDAALALTAGMAMLLAANGGFARLLSLAGFLYAAVYLAGFASVFALRRKNPAPRAFRAWLYPWGTAVVALFCVAFLIADVIGNPRDAFGSMLLLAAGYPVYRLSRQWSL